MSKLIIDMPMPSRCGECPLLYMDIVTCTVTGKDCTEYGAERPSWCPIKGVLPDEHGTLVDYDEVEKEFNRLLTYMEEVPDENGVVWFRRETIVPRGYEMKFHTIVPAERSEHENPQHKIEH